MQPIFFTKLSTLGKNYLILNFLEQEEFIKDYSELAQQMTHYQDGILADGIIILTPSKIAHLKMTIYKANGARLPTCGNSLHLVGHYLKDFDHFNVNVVHIETDSDISKIIYDDSIVSVDLGIAHTLKEPRTPLLLNSNIQSCSRQIQTSLGTWNVDTVLMGNPHFIIYTDENHPSFFNEIEKISQQHDVNIGLVTILNDTEFKLTTYKRETGFKEACHANTAAAVASSVVRGFLKPYELLIANLPHGILHVKWDEQGHLQTTLTTTKVCCGTYFIKNIND